MSKSMPVVGAREAKNQRAASTPTSSSSSSRVTNSPERLRHRDLLAVAHEADPGDEQHLDRVAVEAQRLGRVLEPGDRAVVVGAPDVDQLVKAAAELLRDVADVRGEVGRLAVGADDDAVLVVAEGGGAEPQRAVLLVHVAGLLELLDALARPSRRHGATPRPSRRRSARRGRPGCARSRRGSAPTPSADCSVARSASSRVGLLHDLAGTRVASSLTYSPW